MARDRYVPADALPRPDLQESAFRRFEPFIAAACYTKELRLSALEIKCKPSTFIARFRDATLAKERYGYVSTIIPPNARLRELRAYPLRDGGVVVVNEAAVAQERLAGVVAQSSTPALAADADLERQAAELRSGSNIECHKSESDDL